MWGQLTLKVCACLVQQNRNKGWRGDAGRGGSDASISHTVAPRAFRTLITVSPNHHQTRRRVERPGPLLCPLSSPALPQHAWHRIPLWVHHHFLENASLFFICQTLSLTLRVQQHTLNTHSYNTPPEGSSKEAVFEVLSHTEQRM